MSPVLIFTPISRGTIAETTSQSVDVPVRIPVAPIKGFNKIGGTTNEASFTTSPIIGSARVVLVEELEVVDVSLTSTDVSSDPPHAENISNKTTINIFNFLICTI